MSAWAPTRRDYTANTLRACIKLGGCNRRSFSSSLSRWKSCYQILGVSRSATQAEIKRAYFELSKIEHPDRSTRSDAMHRFANINAAHTVLRSKETRETYDQQLDADIKAQEAMKAARAAGAKDRKQQEQEGHRQSAASAKPSAKPTSTPFSNKTARTSSSTNSSPSAAASSSGKQSLSRTTSSGEPKPRHLEGAMFGESGSPHYRTIARRPRPRPPPLASLYVPGQPPSRRDQLRHQMIQNLERANVSHLLFPRGNDPCQEMGIWHYTDPWNDGGPAFTPGFTPFPGRRPDDYIPLLVLGYSRMQTEDIKRALDYSRRVTPQPTALDRIILLVKSAFDRVFT